MRLVPFPTHVAVVLLLLLIVLQGRSSWTIIVPTFTTTAIDNYYHRSIWPSSDLLLLSPRQQRCCTTSYTEVRACSRKNNDNNYYTCYNHGIHNPTNRTDTTIYLFNNPNMQRKQILTLGNRLFLFSYSTVGQLPSHAASSIQDNSNPRYISNGIATSCNNDHRQLPQLWHIHHPQYYDIPKKPPNTIRLYLIRHGQTENNRLNIVQGAHVDTPLNDRGKLQATLLGQALNTLQQQQRHRCHYYDTDNVDNSLVFLHSTYQRSQETATIAASTYYCFNNNDLYDNYRNNMQELPTIGTIDFGLQEKKKYEMNQIYSSWSLGLIDVKLAEGETCRQVRVFMYLFNHLRFL